MQTSKKLRIVYLESSYSFLFKDLNRELAPEWSHTLLFSFGYYLYKPTKEFTFIRQCLPRDSHYSEDVELPPCLINSNIRKATDMEASEVLNFKKFLKEFLINNSVNVLICHNDLRWQHAISKIVCAEIGIKILFFEEGYFRPNTITIDSSGVNANASISRSLAFYLNSNTTTYDLKNFSKIPILFRILRIWYFCIFIMMDRVGYFLKLNSIAQNKKYDFLFYFKLLIFKIRTRFFSKKVNFNLKENYIFIPLQVSDDTQTIIHSMYKNTQEFISDVENIFYSIDERIRKETKLVFKKHPMEGSKEYKFSNRSIITNADTNLLIENSIGVLLINSSTIAQCLVKKKPVICTGSTFFNIPKITIYSTKCSLLENIILLLSQQLDINYDAFNKVLDYLKYEYQYNMNLYYYEKEDMIKFAKRLYEKELKDI